MMLLAQRKHQLKNSTGYTPHQRLCSDGKTYETHPKLVKASKYFQEGLRVHIKDHSTVYDYSWAHVAQRRSDSIWYNPQHRLVLQSSSGGYSTEIPIFACRLHPKYTDKLQHFAHIMEQLYGCLDYWMDNAFRGDTWNNNDDDNIQAPPRLFLLHNATDQADPLKSGQQVEFIKGVMEVLEKQLEVRRMSIQQFVKLDGLKLLLPNDALNQTMRNNSTHDSDDFSDSNSTTHCHFNQGALQDDNDETVDNHTCALLDAIPNFLDPLQGFLFRHGTEWNALIRKHHGLRPRQQSTSRCDIPRIRILSRKQTRRIINADQLARLLKGRLVSIGGKGQQHSLQLQDVSVEYFENAGFVQQFQSLQSTDILISGHGAQLTGLPFMVETLSNRSDDNNAPPPNTCKQLLELYPKHYALPYYFGSLAVQTGIAHSYMYLQDDQDEVDNSNNETSVNTKTVYPWEVRRAHTYKERFQSRRVNLCPDTSVMMRAIVDLVRDWYTCCTANAMEEGKRL
ncbi:MAG: hypothetical protein SGILL_007590 [Bacillariaceae sp.]